MKIVSIYVIVFVIYVTIMSINIGEQ